MDSLEAFVLWNFAMDLLLASSAARACAREAQMPCIHAAVLGTLYALAGRLWWPVLLHWLPAMLCGALMALMAVCPDSLNGALRAVSALVSVSLFMGGAQMLAANLFGSGFASAATGALAGALMYIWLGRVRQARMQTWDVQLFLRTKNGCVRFRALVDTGNRLSEPVSGLPVMIVEERAIRRALPEGFDAQEAARNVPRGWRLVSYGVLGGAGRMACFRPDRLLVRYGERWLLAPDIWVAVYPGRIPGQVAALAPTVLGTIEQVELGIRVKGLQKFG